MSAGRKKGGIDRREFVRWSLGGAAALAAATRPEAASAGAVPPLSTAPSPPSTTDTKLPVSPFELEDVSVSALQAGMKSGRWTAASLTRSYLSRIASLDRVGPSLRAVIELNPDAAAIAQSLDAERKARGPRGPLHGIPVLIKDNIATGDKMCTTAGSLALDGWKAANDAFVVARLRAAGAVILGKTNLSEWANIRSTHSSSGWSARGGQTRNPYALDRTPCGSSSGSGAAIAASLAAIAVGTETDGSIVCPSSMCGLVGIKPTVGLVSRTGIIPISHSQDTAGPMARTVADAAALLGVLAGSDPHDPATAQAAKLAPPDSDYTRFLDANGLRGARIGVARKFFGASEHGDAPIEAALQAMKRAGAILIDPVELDATTGYDAAELEVLLYELKHDLDAWLGAQTGAPVRSLAEVIAFNRKNAAREMPWFGQDLFEKAQAKGPLTDRAYVDALATGLRLSRAEGIDRVMDHHRLDALVAPTVGPAWPIDWIDGDHSNGGCTSPAAVAGYPHITVPAGFVFGLPVGISLFGRAWSEPVLIKLAYAFEQATHLRRPPRFHPSADLPL